MINSILFLLDKMDINKWGESWNFWVERKFCFFCAEFGGVLKRDKKVCCGALGFVFISSCDRLLLTIFVVVGLMRKSTAPE
jgi:hypothetical protein